MKRVFLTLAHEVNIMLWRIRFVRGHFYSPHLLCILPQISLDEYFCSANLRGHTRWFCERGWVPRGSSKYATMDDEPTKVRNQNELTVPKTNNGRYSRFQLFLLANEFSFVLKNIYNCGTASYGNRVTTWQLLLFLEDEQVISTVSRHHVGIYNIPSGYVVHHPPPPHETLVSDFVLFCRCWIRHTVGRTTKRKYTHHVLSSGHNCISSLWDDDNPRSVLCDVIRVGSSLNDKTALGPEHAAMLQETYRNTNQERTNKQEQKEIIIMRNKEETKH